MEPKSWQATRIDVDEKRLRRTVEDVLSEHRGCAVRVLKLERKPSEFATLFPADVVSVTLDDGEQIRLFAKYLGNEEADHPDKLGPRREVEVYKKLFRQTSLPVPRYFGHRSNETTGREELFLEFVDDWSLVYQDLDSWHLAARELALLQRHFANETRALESCDVLQHIDGEYFEGWTRRARQAVDRQAPPLTTRLETALKAYEPAIEILVAQPVTLVHNDLAPKNVIVDRSLAQPRTFFIDWETAGVGCAVLDLVQLKYGLDEDQDRKLCDLYRSELLGSNLLPSTEGEFERVRLACEAHKSLHRMAHCESWQLKPESVAEFVSEFESSLKGLNG